VLTFWCDEKSFFCIVEFRDEFRYLNQALDWLYNLYLVPAWRSRRWRSVSRWSKEEPEVQSRTRTEVKLPNDISALALVFLQGGVKREGDMSWRQLHWAEVVPLWYRKANLNGFHVSFMDIKCVDMSFIDEKRWWKFRGSRDSFMGIKFFCTVFKIWVYW
jgi:hypothetical protein